MSDQYTGDEQTDEAVAAEQAEFDKLDEATAETKTSEDKFDVNTLKTCYFYPDQLDAAQSLVGKLTETGSSIRFNWRNIAGEQHAIPEGFGLQIIPIFRRADKAVGEEGNQVDQVLVCQVPTPETVGGHDLGAAFITKTILDAIENRLIKFAKTAETDEDWNDIPNSIDAFLTAPTRGEGLKSWSKLGPQFVKKLKKKGLRDLTLDTLQACLRSKKASERLYPDLSQVFWTKLIEALIVMAPNFEENGQPAPLPVQAFQHWLDTRETVEVATVDESEFDELFAEFGIGDDVGEEAEVEAAE